jgi:hypothetical protein
MTTATIYLIKSKVYLLFPTVKTVSGFRVGVDPYLLIAETASSSDLTKAIKTVLNTDESQRVPDPKNWTEFDKIFLQKTGLKSLKELHKPTTKNLMVSKAENFISFSPTKAAEKPDEGFVNKSKDEPDVVVSYTASDEEIRNALELAIRRCE